MNTLLWVLQGILAVKLAATAVSHALQHHLDTMQEAIQNFGPAVPSLYTAAGGMLLVGLALLLPAVAKLPSWFVIYAAGAASVMFLASMGFHLAAREDPKLFVSGILFAMSVFLMYGRLALVPL